MYERKKDKLASRQVFIQRLISNISIGMILILSSLGIGMVGYLHFEDKSWLDSYLDASMILSGMGPVEPIKTESGKLFAGSYALFSGIIFLVFMGFIFAPVFHRFYHRFHLENK